MSFISPWSAKFLISQTPLFSQDSNKAKDLPYTLSPQPIIIHKIRPILSHCNKNPTSLIAEVGVFDGGTVSILSDNFLDSTIYAYDTFEGLPESCWIEGESWEIGAFKPNHDVVKYLSNRKNVVVRKGIFPDSIGEETGFWMVHLDLDYYLSTLNALKVLVPRMATGGAIFLDDWDWPSCPGVRKAVEDLGLQAEASDAEYQAVIRF